MVGIDPDFARENSCVLPPDFDPDFDRSFGNRTKDPATDTRNASIPESIIAVKASGLRRVDR